MAKYVYWLRLWLWFNGGAFDSPVCIIFMKLWICGDLLSICGKTTTLRLSNNNFVKYMLVQNDLVFGFACSFCLVAAIFRFIHFPPTASIIQLISLSPEMVCEIKEIKCNHCPFHRKPVDYSTCSQLWQKPLDSLNWRMFIEVPFQW